MAKLTSPLTCSGTLHGVNFFTRGGGHFLRRKPGPDTAKWRLHPHFLAARENAAAFGLRSRVAAELYRQLGRDAGRACLPYTHNRIARALRQALQGEGRLPRALNPRKAAEALHGLNLGAVPAALCPGSGRRPRPSPRRPAAAMHTVSFHLPADGTGTIQAAGLRSLAQNLLRPHERPQFRIHLALLQPTGYTLDPSSRTLDPDSAPCIRHAPAASIWMPAPEDDSPIDIPLPAAIEQGDPHGQILAVVIEWRALHGRRVRLMHEGTVALCLHLPSIQPSVKRQRGFRPRRRPGRTPLSAALRIRLGLGGLRQQLRPPAREPARPLKQH